MQSPYEVWARFDVEKELERVDEAEQREQQVKDQEKKVVEKRRVEDSISRSTEQSAEVLAAQAAVAALKAKGRGRRGQTRKAATTSQQEELDVNVQSGEIPKEPVAIDELERRAQLMKRKHDLIMEILAMRRTADAKVKEASEGSTAKWLEAQLHYEKAIEAVKALEEMIPHLQEIDAEVANTSTSQPHDVHGHDDHKEHSAHESKDGKSHDHHGGCGSGCSRSHKHRPKKPKDTEASLPKPNDVKAVVTMFAKDCYLGLGTCELAQRRLAAASEAFKEVLLRDQNHVQAWMQRGAAFEAMGAPLLAWLHYNRVTGMEPSFDEGKQCEERIKTKLAHGKGHSTSDHSAEVSHNTSSSLKSRLDAVRLLVDEGHVIMVEGFYAYAITKFEAALQLMEALTSDDAFAPHSSVARPIIDKLRVACHLNIASGYYEMQKGYAVGRRHCLAALQIDPKHAVTLFRLAQIDRVAHDYEQALQYLDKCTAALTDPTSDTIDKIARERDKCLFEQSQYDAVYIRHQLNAIKEAGS
ncbi:hypothetical protein Poli38472_011628 [Pythium oligandrum]|uniref:Uncharacterized protein n=1 Tax=Pythium oligandrum TaxID=41045 RepID=A0A8K1CLX8_PYTOL|nr:hypothetical protein Poli38472_011628 [Pythium oligandrum]|eukprot:TMW64748.1 hypothetical protein Poli38472_011628 [Pythium oligandrum]